MALKLISLYREKPILWDSTQNDYKNIKKKYDCWTELASEMGADVTSVKKKMDSLLGSFRRERSRQEDTRRSGAGTDDMYVSKWFAFNDMKFLANKFTPRQTKDTINPRRTEKVSVVLP